MNTELQLFVREALAKGASRKEVKEKLAKAGWPKDEIDAALDMYADTAFVVPVPRRKPYLSAREAFFYLVMFMTLYISAFSFGTILFQLINTFFPDPVQYPYTQETVRSMLRSATSAIIIAFPVYLWISTIIAKTMQKDPDKRGSKIRKWLTYITLFIAAGVIIGDLIGLVNGLLSGELTLRFILKALTVGLIAGTIFGYYLWDLRQDEKEAD